MELDRLIKLFVLSWSLLIEPRLESELALTAGEKVLRNLRNRRRRTVPGEKRF